MTFFHGGSARAPRLSAARAPGPWMLAAAGMACLALSGAATAQASHGPRAAPLHEGIVLPAAIAPQAGQPSRTRPVPQDTPVSTAPVSTAPVSTAPPGTAPASTAPASTAPVSTASPGTAPVSTASPGTAPVWQTLPARQITPATQAEPPPPAARAPAPQTPPAPVSASVGADQPWPGELALSSDTWLLAAAGPGLPAPAVVAQAAPPAPGGPDSAGPVQAAPPGAEAPVRELAPDRASDGIVRVALLLPLGSEDDNVAQTARSLQQAAELALFDFSVSGLLLTPKDTLGTPDGARAAVEEALEEQADLILGPLFAPAVRAAAPAARAAGVPVIAFSTDETAAGEGVYLLSFLPEQDAVRVTDFAMDQGLRRFAALVPQTTYGARVTNALSRVIGARGGELVTIESYPPTPAGALEATRRLSQYEERVAALEARRAQAQAAEDTVALEALAGLETWGEVPYEAVLVPEGGQMLRSVAPLLPYFDVGPPAVRLLGTGLWAGEDTAQEPTLHGGWYPAPAPQARTRFLERFARTYGHDAPRIASLAYDAVSLAAALASDDLYTPFTREALTDPNGFAGTDGVFRLRPDGLPERQLAVLEATAQGPRVVSPALGGFVRQPGAGRR